MTSRTLLALACALPLSAQEVVLRNELGLDAAMQPAEFPLAEPAPAGLDVVVDAAGTVVGQVSADRTRVFVRTGLTKDQADLRFTLAKAGAPGLAHPVTIAEKTWTPIPNQAGDNGVETYYEIGNGRCGVRVPKSVRAGALPGRLVPVPIIGIQHADGEWAGRPDFRSIMVPVWDNYQDKPQSVPYQFTSFTSRIVEQGPERITVRIEFTGAPTDEMDALVTAQGHAPEKSAEVRENLRKRMLPLAPYLDEQRTFAYEVTVFADERMVEIRQDGGKANDWYCDLNAFKPTPWRATRWRTGHAHHWEGLEPLVLPDHKGQTIVPGFTAGAGPVNREWKIDGAGQWEMRGEGESDIVAKPLWLESEPQGFGWSWLRQASETDRTSYVRLKGMAPWYPWRGIGTFMYLLDPAAKPTDPVVGLLNGPASVVRDWPSRDNPSDGMGFSQHIPAQLTDHATAVYGHLANWRYAGIADRDQVLQVARWHLTAAAGSFFLWIGRTDEVPAVLPQRKENQEDITFTSQVWQDWARYGAGVATVSDMAQWHSAWPDGHAAAGAIGAEAVTRNRALVNTIHMGDSAILPLWKEADDAARLKRIDQWLANTEKDLRWRLGNVRNGQIMLHSGLPWYNGDRVAAAITRDLAAFCALGRVEDGGLIDAARWSRMKTLGAAWFQITYDEDRAMFWNPGVQMNHGGGSMESDAFSARFGIVRDFPLWPGAAAHRDRPLLETQRATPGQLGRWGAEFTATHYSSLAAITPLQNELLAQQTAAKGDPVAAPDEFARDPRLRHHAFLMLNRLGVKDPRQANLRMPHVFGNCGPGWGTPGLALAATGFRGLDPQLAGWLDWAYVANGRSTQASVGWPFVYDFSQVGSAYPFPALAVFPGHLTVQRLGGGTPDESMLSMSNGYFRGQHREQSENNEVQIDLLGKPVVTKPQSYATPQQEHWLLRNGVGPAVAGWDQDGAWFRPAQVWGNDRLIAAGSWQQGSWTRSRVDGELANHARNPDGSGWDREALLVQADADLPIVILRDTMLTKGEWVSTLRFQASGAIGLGGKRIELALPTPTVNPDGSPVAGPATQAVALASGSPIAFTGHDWLKLYPHSLERAGVQAADLGERVDMTVVPLADGALAGAVGQWRTSDGSMQHGQGDERWDLVQFLRTKFTGTQLATVVVAHRAATVPTDLAISGTPGRIVITYTRDGAPRRIEVTATGYTISGPQPETVQFPAGVPEQLYPGYQDLPYHHAATMIGAVPPRLTISGTVAWANGTYEQIPDANVSGMLKGVAPQADPLARLGAALDVKRPSYRSLTGDRMSYVVPLAGTGWAIARLPGTAAEGWIEAPAAAEVPTTGWMTVSPDGTQRTPCAGKVVR
jgi:hypothetical protein